MILPRVARESRYGESPAGIFRSFPSSSLNSSWLPTGRLPGKLNESSIKFLHSESFALSVSSSRWKLSRLSALGRRLAWRADLYYCNPYAFHLLFPPPSPRVPKHVSHIRCQCDSRSLNSEYRSVRYIYFLVSAGRDLKAARRAAERFKRNVGTKVERYCNCKKNRYFGTPLVTSAADWNLARTGISNCNVQCFNVDIHRCLKSANSRSIDVAGVSPARKAINALVPH